MVAGELGGDAERIWRGRTAQETMQVFRRVTGVGPGLANMLVSLLRRCKDVNFPDIETTDVKADVHVRRVLERLGLVISGARDQEVWSTARRLNREDPAALDPPLWMIGYRWCHAGNPNCASCVMKDLCPRIGVNA
jgi:endonuclease III